ncbi:uncharacterized protein LOC143658412 [Tamandua tetradactyla]|uniref:uncharacterized protein LOC143658412 n=1 Tax=Tamandua tetradactyla TaxID=48850 RepID=UPI0040544AB7
MNVNQRGVPYTVDREEVSAALYIVLYLKRAPDRLGQSNRTSRWKETGIPSKEAKRCARATIAGPGKAGKLRGREQPTPCFGRRRSEAGVGAREGKHSPKAQRAWPGTWLRPVRVHYPPPSRRPSCPRSGRLQGGTAAGPPSGSPYIEMKIRLHHSDPGTTVPVILHFFSCCCMEPGCMVRESNLGLPHGSSLNAPLYFSGNRSSPSPWCPLLDLKQLLLPGVERREETCQRGISQVSLSQLEQGLPAPNSGEQRECLLASNSG